MTHTTARNPKSDDGRATTAHRLAVAPVTFALVATIVATTSATASALVPGSAGTSLAGLAWTVIATERPSLIPGGSVYDSQVPLAARTADAGSQGRLYDSQVPAAARHS